MIQNRHHCSTHVFQPIDDNRILAIATLSSLFYSNTSEYQQMNRKDVADFHFSNHYNNKHKMYLTKFFN